MTQRSALISGNIQDQIYNLLKSDILYGVYAQGTQLKEMELAEHFQVSRSPVREALRRLCGDGLLELRSNCGMFVRVFSPKYVRDLLRTRVILESQGMCELSARGLREEERKALRSLRTLAQGAMNKDGTELTEHMQIDEQLHRTFNDFNDNEIMDEVWQRMTPVNVVVQRLSLKNESRARQSQEEHIQVIDYLLSGEVEKAIAMNKLHITHTQAEVERALAHSGQHQI